MNFNLHKPLEHRSFYEQGGGNYALKLLWCELEYDVKYDLYKRSQSVSDTSDESALKIFKITDKDDDWLLRCFNKAISNFKIRLTPYSHDRGRISSDELLDKPTEFNIPLRFEDGWRGSIDALLNCAHEYVVNYTLSEWLMKAGSSMASTYVTLANQYANQAYDIANTYNLEDTPIFRF